MKTKPIRLFVLASTFTAATLWAGSPENAATAPATTRANPSSVLARYFESGSAGPPWNPEMLDIEASIQKLGKRASLSAIRRDPADEEAGKPRYEVLAITGDRTVRQQVIARYVSAEGDAAALPASSVAIGPANYRFRYAGSITEGAAPVYIFEITPRKKRAGLLRGQVWIDAATGAAVHVTGYLVKRPSMFLRRVEITRDLILRGGAVYARVTHLEIDARLLGRAELTVTERPSPSDSLGSQMDTDAHRLR
jgi:hypothetical protein